VNFGTPVPLLLGIFLILGAVALFFLDRLKPGYERDYDKVYAILFLISGFFLLGHLTMELLASFQQLIMVGVLTSLMIQNIRSRTPITNRYGQSAGPDEPLPRDSYRPARSRPDYTRAPQTNVRAELDRRNIPPEPRYSRPMLGGYDDQSRSRTYDRDPYYSGGTDKSYPESYSDKPYSDKPYSDTAYPDKPYSDKPYSDSTYRDSGSGYSDSSYSGQYGDETAPDQTSRSDDYYSGGSRPDVRLRRKRPSSRPRGDYRLNPGDSLR
jgi:hypothetical protein